MPAEDVSAPKRPRLDTFVLQPEEDFLQEHSGASKVREALCCMMKRVICCYCCCCRQFVLSTAHNVSTHARPWPSFSMLFLCLISARPTTAFFAL